MWVMIFGFLMLIWVIIKNEKSSNRSIQILEDRINQQQFQIRNLQSQIEDLKHK